MAYIRSALPAFQHRNDIYRGASVTAYEPDANGAATAVKVTLYTLPTGSNQLANPQVLDGEGKFKQPVYVEVPCVLVISSAFAASHATGVINPPLSAADAADALAAATAASVSAAAAAASAIEAAAAAETGGDRYWPVYWRHNALYNTVY